MMARRAVAALGLLLLAGVARADEVLAIAPGHTLSFHASPAADKPVTASYAIEAAAGDWLMVVAPASLVKGSATEPALLLEGPAGGKLAEEFGTLVRALPQAGTYRLTATGFHALRIARYPAGHPVVDPGLRSQDVALAAGPLGARTRVTVQPAEPFYADRPPPSGWPAAVQIDAGDAMTIRIFRVDGIRQMDEGTRGWSQDIDGLQRMLLGAGQSEAIAPRIDLPWYPAGEGYVSFVARPERLRTACVRFLRYLARFTQESVWPFAGLTYVASGLSVDGRYYITAEAPVELSPAPGQPKPETQDGASITYEAALRKRLQADPAPLTPRLAALDAVLTSLSLPCAQQ